MATDPSKIYGQIEAGANLFAPATYRNYLQFFQDHILELDPGDFIPITAVRNLGAENRILFAVGVIPPAANVTGKLLDRSGSVAATGLETAPEGNASSALPATPPKSSGQDPVTRKSANGGGGSRGARQILEEAFLAVMGREATPAEMQYLQSVAVLETGYGNTWKRNMIGSNNWGAIHCPGNRQNDPNCVQYTDSHPDGTQFTVSFKKYDTPKEGAADLVRKIFKDRPKTAAALANGGTVMDASFAMRREKYYGGFCPKATAQYGAQAARDSFGNPDKNKGTRACAQECVEAHAKRIHEIAGRIAGDCGDPYALGLGTYAETSAAYGAPGGAPGGPVDIANQAQSDWQNSGSANAQNAANQSGATSGTSLNQSETGQQFQKAQQLQALVTKLLLDAMAKTPPLKMLVNPSQFSVKGEKIIQDGNWGRNGPIIEHWGDGQDKLSASGTLAGFYSIDRSMPIGPGLTRTARSFSESWANFQSLHSLYRNNGVLFLKDYGNPAGNTVNLSHVGSIYIYYDGIMYIGSFDNFTVTESDTKPFSAEYSFEFTVRAAFMLDRNDDLVGYGTPQRPTVPTSTPPASPPATQQGPNPSTVKTDSGGTSTKSTSDNVSDSKGSVTGAPSGRSVPFI